MYIEGWGRFNIASISGEPFRTFKIARKDGVISTYYLDGETWVKLSTATDGFNDRVRAYFAIDTSWDASAGVSHSAVFNAINMGPENPTSVMDEDNNTLPKPFTMEQNYPNPFNPNTTIQYTIPADYSGQLTLKIYDLRGALIRSLVNHSVKPGMHSAIWDGNDENGKKVSSGIYIYQLKIGQYARSNRMILLR
jgi:hypothetical protein